MKRKLRLLVYYFALKRVKDILNLLEKINRKLIKNILKKFKKYVDKQKQRWYNKKRSTQKQYEGQRAHWKVNNKPLKKTNSGSYLYYHKKQINEL